MLALVEHMEVAAASLASGKQRIPPQPYNEAAMIGIIAGRVWIMAASSLSGSMRQGIRPKRARAWDNIAACR